MKKLWIPALAGMTVWATMTLTEAVLERTPPSQAAQSTYDLTVIAEFGPFETLPSLFSNGPLITNDGTVVYSVGRGPSPTSSIFSGDGTVTRQLVGFVEHAFKRLQFSVSGNGLMVSNLFEGAGTIIDVHDGTYVGGFGGAGSGIEGFYQVAVNNDGSVAFTGGIPDQCVFGDYLAPDGGVFRWDGGTITTIATLGLPTDLFTVIAYPSINERGQVAFVVTSVGNLCPATPGIEAGDLYVGDGTRLVKIGETFSAPSLNNRGEVAFIGETDGVLSLLVSDGKHTRIIADLGPLPNPGYFFTDDVFINDRGEVSSLAINNKGQIAFQTTLDDGRTVVVRADPKEKPKVN